MSLGIRVFQLTIQDLDEFVFGSTSENVANFHKIIQKLCIRMITLFCLITIITVLHWPFKSLYGWRKQSRVGRPTYFSNVPKMWRHHSTAWRIRTNMAAFRRSRMFASCVICFSWRDLIIWIFTNGQYRKTMVIEESFCSKFKWLLYVSHSFRRCFS